MQSLPQRLLVVEDDVAVARALSRTLARAGSSVTIARSCSAARSLSQDFDFAILDLDLPDGNGVDLARTLLSTGRVPSVLFFTSSAETALLQRARRLGAVLVKSLGTTPILTFFASLAAETSDVPQSRTAHKRRSRSHRASSSSALRARAR